MWAAIILPTIQFYLDKSTDIWLTVPSPPQTRIRRLGTLLYISNLQKKKRKCKKTCSERRKKEIIIYHVLPLPRTSLSQVKHLPGVQVPHERADDFGSLHRQEEVLLCGCKIKFLCNKNCVWVLTWFPPLFGLTNTSKGFMSWEGIGLTTKCFHLPSCWELNIEIYIYIYIYIWRIYVTFIHSSSQ